MAPDEQRRAFDLIERSLWFRPKTRPRRLADAMWDYIEGGGKDTWVAALYLLPVLLTSWSAARAVEAVQRARISSRYRRSRQNAEERLAVIQRVREQIDVTSSPYRDSALTKVLASLSPELAVLFIEGSRGWLIRYTIHAPVEEWPDDRGIEGVCLLVAHESELLAPFNVWREAGRESIAEIEERIGDCSNWATACRITRERWSWNHGSFSSLAFRVEPSGA